MNGKSARDWSGIAPDLPDIGHWYHRSQDHIEWFSIPWDMATCPYFWSDFLFLRRRMAPAPPVFSCGIFLGDTCICMHVFVCIISNSTCRNDRTIAFSIRWILRWSRPMFALWGRFPSHDSWKRPYGHFPLSTLRLGRVSIHRMWTEYFAWFWVQLVLSLSFPIWHFGMFWLLRSHCTIFLWNSFMRTFNLSAEWANRLMCIYSLTWIPMLEFHFLFRRTLKCHFCMIFFNHIWFWFCFWTMFM